MSRSASGENSVVQMIGSLLDSIESDYGVVATRLYRAFRPQPSKLIDHQKLFLTQFIQIHLKIVGNNFRKTKLFQNGLMFT